MLIQASFFIPLSDGLTGDLHPYTKFERLEKELFIMFGGWTDAGIVRGCWRDPDTGKPVYDRSKKYNISLDQGDIPKLKRYLKKAKELFGQKSLYFEVKGEVELL